MKSGNFKFLEPSGPLQACNGTALPSPLQLQLTDGSRYDKATTFGATGYETHEHTNSFYDSIIC